MPNTQNLASLGYWGPTRNRIQCYGSLGAFCAYPYSMSLHFWDRERYIHDSYKYQALNGTAADAYSALEKYDISPRMALLYVFDNPLILQFTYDGINYVDERRFDVGRFLIEVSVGYRVKNATAGLNSRYQILFME